jgi:hypothetical protein
MKHVKKSPTLGFTGCVSPRVQASGRATGRRRVKHVKRVSLHGEQLFANRLHALHAFTVKVFRN